MISLGSTGNPCLPSIHMVYIHTYSSTEKKTLMHHTLPECKPPGTHLTTAMGSSRIVVAEDTCDIVLYGHMTEGQKVWSQLSLLTEGYR